MSAINLGLHSKAGNTPPVKERVSIETLPTDRPTLWVWALFAVFVAGMLLLHAIPSKPPIPSPRELIELNRG